MVRDRYVKSDARLGGARLASSDLLVSPAGGGEATRVLRMRGGFAWPSWDPSGERLAFTALGGAGKSGLPPLGQRRSIEEVNADGSCRKPLLAPQRGFFAGVAWQPGADRGAGLIACG